MKWHQASPLVVDQLRGNRVFQVHYLSQHTTWQLHNYTTLYQDIWLTIVATKGEDLLTAPGIWL